VTPENLYDKAGNEPNDLDLVSVEARFDVQELYKNFRESFFEDVDDQWADPCLAKPVFAAVQLQRQQLDDQGRWGDWQDVPRARIDHNKELFKIVEDIKGMPAGGLKVQMLQFDYKQTQIDLLQPPPYQFASAREEWFPPSLHGEYVDFKEKELQEERRKAREEAREARDSTRGGGRRSGTDTYGTTGGSRGGRGGSIGQPGGGTFGNAGSRNRSSRGRDSSSRTGTGLQGEGGLTGGSRRRGGSSRRSPGGDQMGDAMYGLEAEGFTGGIGATQRGPRRPTINDVYLKYDEIALTRLTDFSKIREPLAFWAYDDTVEPENTYRYRIRLGVFNALAGTNKMSERDKALSNQVILWSDFSNTTDPVEIMGTRYFFANSMREGDKTVNVQIFKLALGHWYSQDFSVKQGVLMGKSLEHVPEEPDRRSVAGAGNFGNLSPAMMGPVGPGVDRRTSAFGTMQDQSNIPEYIDYSTGAVMVDAVPVTDWTGGRAMRARRYYDMLYSFDGINIEHMPIERTNWPSERQTAFSIVARLEREPLEPFKGFGSGGSGRRQGGMYEGMGEEMMYEESYEDMGGLY
jgi:hypothetical protein